MKNFYISIFLNFYYKIPKIKIKIDLVVRIILKFFILEKNLKNKLYF